MPDFIFDEWANGVPTGTVCMVKAASRTLAITGMCGLNMVFDGGPDPATPRPIVPIFCITHGTVVYDGTITYQLRGDPTWPEREPQH